MQITDLPDTYNGISNFAVYNLNNEVTALEILEYMTKTIGPIFVNAQLEDQRNKSDELFIDKKDSEKRVYLFFVKNKLQLTSEIIKGLAMFMKPNSFRIDDQVFMTNTLPFITTTY